VLGSLVADVFFEHLRWRGAPNTFAFHPANGGAHEGRLKPPRSISPKRGLLRKKVD
jgi:hypothetical protein